MLRQLIKGVCSHQGRLILMGSAIGVLAGVERLLSRSPRPKRTIVSSLSAPVTRMPAPHPREHYFQVRRTKSELGYTYWYLQGHGCFQCFLLFDTWREAMDEANIRVHALKLQLASETRRSRAKRAVLLNLSLVRAD